MTENGKVIQINGLGTEVVEREMTLDEIEVRKLLAGEQATLQAEQDAKAAARASALQKLAALGLTEEEIAAL
jgi:hypothetical protein